MTPDAARRLYHREKAKAAKRAKKRGPTLLQQADAKWRELVNEAPQRYRGFRAATRSRDILTGPGNAR
jgi:hypothetical protein